MTRPTTGSIQPVVFVVGPTATGKTDLALQMAAKTGSNILSADSRQVYQGLEITSGADLPAEFSLSQDQVGEFSFHTNGSIDFFGISMLHPDQEWSIAQFRDYAEACLDRSHEQGKKLIAVGGSGLFLLSLFLDKQTIQLPRHTDLRQKFAESSVEELQTQLKQLLPTIEEQMNQSDWNNPRRLIRWMEKLQDQPSQPSEASPLATTPSESMFGSPEDHEWIGLTAEKETLQERILQRVRARIETGAIREVERLLNREPAPTKQVLSTTGIKEIAAHLNDQLSMDELITLWTQREFSFAKRQLTWFKKRPYIQWKQVKL